MDDNGRVTDDLKASSPEILDNGKLNLVLRSVGIGVFRAHGETGKLIFDSIFLSLLGRSGEPGEYDADSWPGHWVWDGDRDEFFRFLREFMDSSSSGAEREVRFLRADGSSVWYLIRLTGADVSEEAGRTVYGLALNIDKRKRADQISVQKLRAERMFVDCENAFCQARDFSDGLARVMAILGSRLGCERTLFVKFRKGKALITNEWIRKGVPSVSRKQSTFPIARTSWFDAQIGKKRIVAVNDPADLPDDAQYEKDQLSSLGLGPLLLVPVVTKDAVIGLYCLEKKTPLGTGKDRELQYWRVGKIIAQGYSRCRESSRIREREARFSHVLMNSSDVILEVDLMGRILYCNKTFEERLEQGKEKIEGSNLADYIHPQDQAAFRARLEGEDGNGNNGHWRLRLFTGPLGYRWYEWKVTPLYNGADKVGKIATGRDITELFKREKRLDYELTHDLLTGLYNSNYLIDYIKTRSSGNESFTLICLYLNVDNFREVNEIYGHDVADVYLVEFGKKLTEVCPDRAMTARISGDEYAILWERDFEEEIFMRRMVEPLAGINGTSLNCSGIVIPLSFTVGYSLYPQDADREEQLIPFAETAMIQAKKEARGSLKRFDRDQYLENLYKREVITDVKVADVASEFDLFYQPIVDVDNENEFLMEALIRWYHPTKGLLAPGRFVDALEESGQIAEIGDVLFKKVLAQIQEWKKETGKDAVISYNLSSASLNRKGEGQLIVDLMEEYGVTNRQIHLEITETLALTHDSVVVDNLKILRDHRIKIALDDFGMHYSTLSLLDKVQFDILKVDIFFTRNIDKPIPHSVVKMIKEIVEVNGKECIVEGVETEEQLKKMTDMGFSKIQGFYFYKPMNSDDVTALLHGHDGNGWAKDRSPS